MFAVAHNDFTEMQRSQKEVAFEVRLDQMNASRPVNKWEGERLMKERQKMMERRRIKFNDAI